MANYFETYTNVRHDFEVQVCGIPIKPGSDIICMRSPRHNGDEHIYFTCYTKNSMSRKKRLLRTISYGDDRFIVVYSKRSFKVDEQLSLFPSPPKTITVRGWCKIRTAQQTYSTSSSSYTTNYASNTYSTGTASVGNLRNPYLHAGYG